MVVAVLPSGSLFPKVWDLVGRGVIEDGSPSLDARNAHVDTSINVQIRGFVRSYGLQKMVCGEEIATAVTGACGFAMANGKVRACLLYTSDAADE